LTDSVSATADAPGMVSAGPRGKIERWISLEEIRSRNVPVPTMSGMFFKSLIQLRLAAESAL